MKNIKTVLKIAGFALFAALLVTGCLQDPPVSNTKSGKGRVELSVGDARTLLPDLGAVAYTVDYGLASGSTTETASKLSFELKAGTYNFTVTGKISGDVIGTGTAGNVVVNAGKTTSVEIYLVPNADGDEGELKWELSFPASGVDTAELEYSNDEGTTWNNLLTAGNTARSGTFDLDPGSYLLRSFLSGAGGEKGDIEAFYIYPGLTTNVEWHYSATGLLAPKDLAGSVTFNTTATVTGVTLTLIGDDGSGGYMDAEHLTLTNESGTWKFETEIPNNITDLGGTLQITTANNSGYDIALKSPIGTIAYADSIIIPQVNIYTLNVTVTGNGALVLDYEGIKLGNGKAIDFVGGDYVSVTAFADPGNRFNKLEIDGTDVGGSAHTITGISADTAAAVTFEAGVDPNALFEWSQSLVPWVTLNQTADPSYRDYTINSKTVRVVVNGGNNAVVDTNGGGALINNVRLVVGQNTAAGNTIGTANTNNWTTNLEGQLDLSSRKFRITIDYANASAVAENWLRVYLNNNSTGEANSSFGNLSRILNITDKESFPTKAGGTHNSHTATTYRFLSGASMDSGTVIVECDPVAEFGAHANYEALKKAFVAITAHSTSRVTITGIKIEYIDEMPALSAVRIYNGAAPVSNTEINMELTDSPIQLAALTVPASDPGTVSWSTSNSAVATCASGLLTPVAPGGPVTITAASGSINSTITVNVADTDPPLALTVEDGGTPVTTTISMSPSDVKTLTAKTDQAGETGVTFAWEVESGTSATITAGDDTATAEITASASVTGSTVIKVTASKTGFTSTSKEITVNVGAAPPPGPGLARIVWGTQGTTSYAGGKLTIKGDGALPAALLGLKYHLVYVKVPTTGAIYDAEVDIVVGESSTAQNTSNNTMYGLMVMKGDPATKTTAQLGYYLNANRNNGPAAPQSMRKPTNEAHNNGGAFGTAPGTATIQTLGILRQNGRKATYTQKLDAAATTIETDGTANRDIIADTDDDVYIGLLVSSNSTALTTMTISALRIKYPTSVYSAAAGDPVDANGYYVIDLSQTIELINVDIPLTGIEITGTGIPSGSGKTLQIDLEDEGPKDAQLGYSISPLGAEGTVAWSSNDTATVEVDSTTGLITAKQTGGPVTITATIPGTSPLITDTLAVTVIDSGPQTISAPGLARIVRGGTGSTSYASGKLTVQGDGILTTAGVNEYHLVYVTVPTRYDMYDVEVDIVLDDCTVPSGSNSRIGLVVMKGNPATQTAANLSFWILSHNNGAVFSQPYRGQKPLPAGSNFGNGTAFGTAPVAGDIETLGYRIRTPPPGTDNGSLASQSINGGAKTESNQTNVILASGDDVYIGLLVSSATSGTFAKLTISALRIKYPADKYSAANGDPVDTNGYYTIDLSQTIDLITP